MPMRARPGFTGNCFKADAIFFMAKVYQSDLHIISRK